MLTDYKFSRITDHDDGSMTVVVRFYAGDITTELEVSSDQPAARVTRYRRIRTLRELTIHLAVAANLPQLRQRFNRMLAKDTTHRPVEWQHRA